MSPLACHRMLFCFSCEPKSFALFIILSKKTEGLHIYIQFFKNVFFIGFSYSYKRTRIKNKHVLNHLAQKKPYNLLLNESIQIITVHTWIKKKMNKIKHLKKLTASCKSQEISFNQSSRYLSSHVNYMKVSHRLPHTLNLRATHKLTAFQEPSSLLQWHMKPPKPIIGQAEFRLSRSKDINTSPA